MMRVQQVNDSIYSGLRALDKRRYLCAMWNVCTELQALYQDRMSIAENTLVLSSLRLVRDVVRQGEATEAMVRDAASLYGQWNRIRSEPRPGVMSGHSNARMVFRELAGEIAGTSESYEATEYLDLAAGDRWREDRVLLVYDPNEEVSDSTPMAQMLTFLQKCVTGVAALPEAWLNDRNWDPQSVQDEITGKPPIVPKGM